MLVLQWAPRGSIIKFYELLGLQWIRPKKFISFHLKPSDSELVIEFRMTSLLFSDLSQGKFV